MAVLGVDLGGMHLRVALVDDSGRVHDRREFATPGTVDELFDLVRTDHAVDHAVIGVPGRVDYAAGLLEYAPNLPSDWAERVTAARCTEALGVACVLANDADLAAVGEAWFGAGRTYSDVAYLTISTGIGAGVVCAGRLLHGRRSIAEVGHTIVDGRALIEGRPATVEELGSGSALERLAAEAGLHLDGAAVVERVRAGDAAASEVLDVVVAAAAVGAVNLAHLFTPEVLVVGGGLGLQGDLVLEPIRRLLAMRGPADLPQPITVVNAVLGDDAGVIGAAAWMRAFA
jgi:glucokinase